MTPQQKQAVDLFRQTMLAWGFNYSHMTDEQILYTYGDNLARYSRDVGSAVQHVGQAAGTVVGGVASGITQGLFGLKIEHVLLIAGAGLLILFLKD